MEVIAQEKTLRSELHNLEIAEENIYRQKSRVQWIKERNKIPNFFIV